MSLRTSSGPEEEHARGWMAPPPRAATADAEPGARLAGARARAVAFLLAQRNRRGWWRDFDTLAGPSDEWVTACVGWVLATAGGAQGAAAARRAWRLLRRRRFWSAGWGYNAMVPADADSTLWALRLARAVGAARGWRVRRGMRFLARHLRPDGGLATYADDGPIRLFTRLQPQVSFAGWCGSHLCVTAAAAGLAGFPARAALLERLRQAQRPDGSWTGYWWREPAYTTALAVQALAQEPGAADRARVERAARWAAGRVAGDGPDADAPAALGWCVEVLAHADGSWARAPLQGAVDRLLAAQRADGSWAPSAWLRIPPPGVVDPERQTAWAIDGRGGASVQPGRTACFTTALILHALARWEPRAGG